MKLVFTWIQWCWKWTQARILQEKFWYNLVEMWAEFRKIVKSWTELWNKVKEVIESGAQVDAELWWEIMREAINSQTSNKIIFDWFIRNTWNKDIFDEIVPEYKAILFNLSVEKAKDRLLGRMFDTETWETFQSWITINPKNWNSLIKREDDKDEKAILKRISEFEEKTLPIIELQKTEWKIIEVNADQTIEEVSKDLINKLWR